MPEKINLSKDIIIKLEDLPEQGIGYQLVDFTLKNGTILEKRTVLNSSILIILKNEKINIEEIISVKIYEKKFHER